MSRRRRVEDATAEVEGTAATAKEGRLWRMQR